MRTAILSDIHANYPALRACYEDAIGLGAERFLFLGDYVSDLAEPERTMALLREIASRHPTVLLRGNRERYMLACEQGETRLCRGSHSGSLLFTYERLGAQDLALFRRLPIADTVEIAGVPVELAHATLQNDQYYFDSTDGRIGEVLSQMHREYLLTGHSHRQYLWHGQGRTVINPGAVGLPHDGLPAAKYALLDRERGCLRCQLRAVPYDMSEVIHAQFASGLLDYARYWAIGALYDVITGEEWVLKLLERVERRGDLQDEDAWRQAATEMGMCFTEAELVSLWRQRQCAPQTRAALRAANGGWLTC